MPPGRYWLVVYVSERPRWQAWLAEHKGKVFVRAAEELYGYDATLLQKDAPGDWVLFDVTSPVPWVRIGLPTIAAPAVTQATDVVTAPVVGDPFYYPFGTPDGEPGPLSPVVDTLKGAVSTSVILGLLGLVGWVMLNKLATPERARGAGPAR